MVVLSFRDLEKLSGTSGSGNMADCLCWLALPQQRHKKRWRKYHKHRFKCVSELSATKPTFGSQSQGTADARGCEMEAEVKLALASRASVGEKT